MRRWMYVTLILFFAVCAAFAGYKLFSGLWSYKKGNAVYNSIKEQAVSSSSAEKESTEKETKSTESTEAEGESVLLSEYEREGKIIHLHASIDYMIWPQYEVDFDMLKDLSEDVCGWIRIEDTHIDYPVVQHDDNVFYLRHGIDGEPLNTGSIYVDYRISSPFGQENTVIYGHNQKNSAMFHDLVLYKDESFAESHPYVILYLPDGTERTYRVFAAYETPADSNTYSMAFAGTESYYSYLLEMKAKSLWDFGVTMSPEDQIVTLSTCTNEADNQRMVVQAKLISTR